MRSFQGERGDKHMVPGQKVYSTDPVGRKYGWRFITEKALLCTSIMRACRQGQLDAEQKKQERQA
jgi:hypothetical protein